MPLINIPERYEKYQFIQKKLGLIPLGTVNPRLQEKVLDILAELEDLGYQPKVYEGLRTIAQQREKVRLGYSKTMNSKHLAGNAVDIADIRWGWDGPAGNLGYKFWQDLGKIVHKDPELIWGGDWGKGYQRYLDYIHGKTTYFVDVAHVQLIADPYVSESSTNKESATDQNDDYLEDPSIPG